ncbi:unnamed protein product [Ceutorhynchus assimilis]|uniref:BTB domain-containing protein n=1 Tax=Ceutorhynchus assimilis TaxID=467358 RepID=A0A9N9QB62_9CUCU|nr:unnamed protein product [Ceutorhynchus assimilis]
MNRNHVNHHQDHNMDSGLGSDDDRRGNSRTTKEQKQLHNQQLVSGCFIDAASLSDDQEPQEVAERRQGALIFQSSIPQFSMLQIEEAACQYPEETNTPFNSIVHEDVEGGSSRNNNNNIGFYVDLSQVADTDADTPKTPLQTKNIFSMVIDFEGPKKDKPTKLSSHLKKPLRPKTIGKGSSLSSSLSSVNSPCMASTSRQSEEEIPKNHPLSQSIAVLSASLVKNLSKSSSSEDNVVEEEELCNNDSESAPIDSELNEVQNEELKSAAEPQQQASCPQFVKLSDLAECHQKPLASTRIDAVTFAAPRMSRSIPESHWVETAFLMSRSACYRSAPHPIEPETVSGSDSESAIITNNHSLHHPKKSARRLGTDLLRMFLEEIGPDVVVEVDGHKLKAHKCILASRCQYFAALLSGNWLEKNGNVISLQGFSYESVYFSLCHIYSGAAHVPDSISLVELASLADMLGLEGLKEVVEHALKQRHCHNFHKPCAGCCTGVLEVLPLSAAYGLDDLYQNCLEWVTEHFVRIWPSRAFATLPRELREKCYRQHCVHLSPDKVLDTIAACDKVLATLPAMRWAEPISQLVLQLADACHLYHRQHFAAVLSSASFHSLDAHLGFGVCDVEDQMLNAAKNLGVDQACRAYSRCCKMLDAHWSRPFADLLNKIKIQLEQCLVNQADRLIRSNAWLRLDTVLRSRIKELTPTAAEPQSRLPRAKPNKTTRSSQLIMSSSEDSSRNSSPGIKHQLPGGSPSLRRSLLLAAKSPQVLPKVPPSPGTNRRSTLTQPTAASQARSVAPPNSAAKSRNLVNKTAPKNVRPSSGGSIRSSSSTSSVIRPNSSQGSSGQKTTVNNSKKSSTVVSRNPSLGKKDTTTRKPDSRSSSPLKPLSNSSPRKLDSRVISPIKANHNIRSPSPLKRPPMKIVQSPKKLKEVPKPVPPVPAMQRSSTFLKEEPTVLGKVI